MAGATGDSSLNKYVVPGTMWFNSGTNFAGVSTQFFKLQGKFDIRRNAQEEVGGVSATPLWALSGDVGDLFTRPDVNVSQTGTSGGSLTNWLLVAIGLITLILLYKAHKA